MLLYNQLTKEVLSSILKSIDEAIHVVNIEGVTVFYNEVAAKHDGLTMDEVLGKPILTVFPSLTERTSTLLKVLSTKQPILNQPQSYLNIHGKIIETLNTTLPIFDREKIVGAVEIGKDYSRIKQLYERLLDLETAKRQMRSRKKHNHYTFEDIKTINPSFQQLKLVAQKLARSDSPMIVFGESGTGKELFVQGVHHASPRREAPFIAQNCAAIPANLLESILFGTIKGSYTGAVDRPGLFEVANGGTLFLDELHAMPIDLQAKLLRVLEDGIVRRVGGVKNITVDVRVMVAMNLHPLKAVEQEKLRHDLFYRLNVLSFELTPLRERRDDILFLTQHFIDFYNEKLRKQIRGLDSNTEKLFLTYQWPGNVRELKHCLEYMMNVADQDILTAAELPIFLKNQKPLPALSQDRLALKDHIEQLERELIAQALSCTNGNINQAAGLLEIPRQTLQYKLKKYRAE
ncbi:sigma 54-interacting transcriptional regulator [Bacillus sp. DNRA2]|uniref:sigma-54 interaction domain-containing protein n=1 Tax=Bacillus sp. DNRA2 TaxID=2723053 RepID=UPI00145EF46D|nr:sigma 54-interacting transcriptional regulator [Bacillus sp. DNRA2]NMD72251.1 sigma 54-interacting transcriptional regulator [Bacillus sp. DNRA2]